MEEDYVSFEDFIPIECFEEYLINKEGKIYSTKSKKFLTSRNRGGYMAITLCKNNKRYDLFLHRLLAKSFIPNLKNKPFINHIDGNKSNNSLNNLEWCTCSENIQHAYNIGLAHGHHLEYTPELRYKIGSGMRGKHHSEEYKEYLRQKMIGRYVSEKTKLKHSISAHKRKIIDTQTGICYNSIKDASEKLNINYKTLHNKINRCKDRRFIYDN